MNRLTVVSFFRNSQGAQIQRFMDQVQVLRNVSIYPVRVVAVYGDCTDDTANDLLRQAEQRDLALTLVESNHGGPVFGSTESLDRLKALSQIGNAGLDAITDEDAFVFYVESDLIWDASTVLHLLEQVKRQQTPTIVAPLIFAGKHFYDVFCFRKNGARFGPFYPYHSELDHSRNAVTEVDSVGSAFVMPAEIARQCRIRNENVLLGFCEDVWAHGFKIVVDPSVQVDHP